MDAPPSPKDTPQTEAPEPQPDPPTDTSSTTQVAKPGTVVRAATPQFFLMLFLVTVAAAIVGTLLAGYIGSRFLGS